MHGSSLRFWQFLKTVASPLRMIPSGIGHPKRPRNLRLSETLSLGEKRFLAVVEVGHQQFLVGGSGNSVSLLTDLPNVLNSEQRSCEVGELEAVGSGRLECSH